MQKQHSLSRNASHLAFLSIAVVSSWSSICPRSLAQVSSNSVVQIQNQSEPGTGFFLKVGDNILFITAKHVLGNSGERVTLQLAGNRQITIPLKDQVPVDEADAAILIVRENLSSIEPLETSSINLAGNEILTVWGYPITDDTTNVRLESRSGGYIGAPQTILDGYSILYSAETQIGFSGGPVLSIDGKVIGMHGRSESIKSSTGNNVRTGNALAVPIQQILKAVVVKDKSGEKIDQSALALQAAKASMRKIYEIMTGSALSDQVLEELSRADTGVIPKYCIEMARAYYYTFFSSLPNMSKASSSLTIDKKIDGIDPAYYALGNLVSRKSADFKKSLQYNRILERSGNAGYLQYSERRIKDKVQSAIKVCSND